MRSILVLVTMGLIIATLGAALTLPGGLRGGSAPSTSSSSSTRTSTSTSITTIQSSSTASPSSTTTYTATATLNTSSWVESTSADSIQGLQLRLTINATWAAQGRAVLVNVSEFNSLGASNNVTKSDSWRVQAALSSCPNADFQPFGVAIYEGYYTAQNVSQGSQLRIFPATPCPMLVRLITGYDFQQGSDLAAVLPGSGSTPMTSSVSINGTYSGPHQSQTLGYNVYTVVAADEWGTTAFLYFEVYPGPVLPAVPSAGTA